jgi:CheY-like chemotaxis protein
MATILVIDNHPVTQRLVSYQLYRYGHSVITPRDNQGAMQRLSEQPVDLVILDISPSEAEGLALLTQMRSVYAKDKLPIVVIASLTQGRLRSDMLSAGANAFLTKPTSSWQLSSLAHELLDQETSVQAY